MLTWARPGVCSKSRMGDSTIHDSISETAVTLTCNAAPPHRPYRVVCRGLLNRGMSWYLLRPQEKESIVGRGGKEAQRYIPRSTEVSNQELSVSSMTMAKRIKIRCRGTHTYRSQDWCRFDSTRYCLGWASNLICQIKPNTDGSGHTRDIPFSRYPFVTRICQLIIMMDHTISVDSVYPTGGHDARRTRKPVSLYPFYIERKKRHNDHHIYAVPHSS